MQLHFLLGSAFNEVGVFKVEESIQRQSEGEATSESLLSKLVPTSVTGPIWTAVICVVGWHLLRTR